MSNKLFLVAHKVRGEPAFDVGIRSECPECRGATCHECGDGYWWIIPTSGHRAYPYWHMGLEPLAPPMPEGLRDHYAVAPRAKLSLEEIIATIGEP
jgi:hypothetical protein